jgi:flagellar motor switch protein FliM
VSTGILSTDEIAALVDAAKHGQLPEQGTGATQRRAPRLRTVDFSRPTKFTSDHQRRLARAIDTFCQTAVTRLSAELRWPIEMEAINTMQLTWSAAQAQLPPGALSTTVEVKPINTRMLLTVEQSFVLMGLECLLGGSPVRPPRERRFSEIDWALTRRLLESLVHQFSLVFEDLGGVSLSAGEIEVHHDGSQVASVSEPTYVVVIETRINKQSSALELLIPWVAIEPVAARIGGRERRRHDDATDDTPGVETALSQAPVTLRAEVASVDLAVQDILALKPGSLVTFHGAKAAEGVSLFAENVKLARALPGANGPRRAIQIRGTAGSGR